MKKRPVLEEVKRMVSDLTPQDQLRLVETLARRLRKAEFHEKKGVDWNELYGLGKGLWTDEDAQDYVSRVRADRA
jgi:hypothetical protein